MGDNNKIPIYKIAMIGPREVGKTSLVSQFVNNSFDQFCDQTVDDTRYYSF